MRLSDCHSGPLCNQEVGGSIPLVSTLIPLSVFPGKPTISREKPRFPSMAVIPVPSNDLPGRWTISVANDRDSPEFPEEWTAWRVDLRQHRRSILEVRPGDSLPGRQPGSYTRREG